MQDLTGFAIHRGIHQAADGLLLAIEQGGVKQGGQLLHRVAVGFRRLPLHQQLQLAQIAQLVQPPHQAAIGEQRRPAHPAQQPMDRRMHPGHHPHPLVQTLGAAHAQPEQIAYQQLIWKAQAVTGAPARASPGR